MQEVPDDVHARFTHYGARAIIKAKKSENAMLNITPYGQASEEEIAALEKTLKFPLPADYRSFLKQYNGGRSEDQAFFVK